MKPLDFVFATLVAVVWGMAFILTKFALGTFSPAQLVFLRFLVGALPILFMVPVHVPWRALIPVGLTLLAGQFLFQFAGIANGTPAGLASVVVQTQAPFTVALAAAMGETPRSRELAGVGIACMGLVLIGLTVGRDLTLIGFSLTIVSPVSFAVGNILLKRLVQRYGRMDMLNLMAWLSLVPPLPALLLVCLMEGPSALPDTLVHASGIDLFCVIYLGLVSGTAAYAIWGMLLQKYTAVQVTPFALLVPFVASLSSAMVFGEEFGLLRLAGMGFVVAGLVVLAFPRAGLRPRVAETVLREEVTNKTAC